MAMTSKVQEGTILLGKYRVEKLLGEGAMGYVVAARHEHLGELFAIKLMLPDALEKPDAAARFLREARACARLKSEHVVRVTDSGENETGVPVMVMEYLVGEDLQNVLDKRHVFPMHEAITYVLQACDAIGEAHDLGIVHRDLKPSNLFLTRRPNGSPCVKVLDFGISKDLNPKGPTVAKLTATGSIVGTPYYMSPEQMQAKATDNRADIWSLGVILYEFATGQLPFPGENYAEVAGKVLYEFPKPPSRIRPGLPPVFDEIVLRCLSKPPEKRFTSVAEFVAALEPLKLLPEPPESIDVVGSGISAKVDVDRDTVVQAKTKTTDDNATLVQTPDKTTIQRPTPQPISAPSPNSSDDADLGNSDTQKVTPNPAESLPGAPVFYAKRVFGHQTGKTWASNSRAGRRSAVWPAIFAFASFGLLAAVYYYREPLRVQIRAWTDSGQAQPTSSADLAHSANEVATPEIIASAMPSATSTATNPRTRSKQAPSTATPKSSATASAAAPPTAAPSAATPAPSAPAPAPAPAPSAAPASPATTTGAKPTEAPPPVKSSPAPAKVSPEK